MAGASRAQRQEDMARQEIDYTELLDVDGLRRECETILKRGSMKLLEMRAALLPIFRRASNEGREKARELLAGTAAV